MVGGQGLKIVLGIWRDAVDAYNAGDNEGAIHTFLRVEELSARMLYNMACAYIRMDKITLALQCLSAAVKKDKHLAIAFFQKGVLNFKQCNYKGAIHDLGQAKLLMRGNTFIDYKPLGMLANLGKFEILYNIALACLHDNHTNEAEGLFTEALHDADIRQRKLLISALKHVQDKTPELATPIDISITNIFTPPKVVVENLQKKNVMASAKVVSAEDKNDTDPTFNGMKRVEELKRSPVNTPKIPRSPLAKVKQFLWKQSRVTSASFGDLPTPSKMRPTLSTGDIRSLTTTHGGTEEFLSHSMTSTALHAMHRSCGDTSTLVSPVGSPTSSLEDFEIRPRSGSGESFRILHSISLDSGHASSLKEVRNSSIEEACTTSATCIARAVSSNCDVTIVVTPPATNSNVHCILKSEGDKVCVNNVDKQSTEENGSDNVDAASAINVEQNNNKVDSDNVDVTDGSSPQTKCRTRPPPPSYPPPPLPATVVFTI